VLAIGGGRKIAAEFVKNVQARARSRNNRGWQHASAGCPKPRAYNRVTGTSRNVHAASLRSRAGDEDGAHAGALGGGDAEWAVFEDEAFGGRDAHPLSGEQEQIRRGFAVGDFFGGDHDRK
jgi:hypothetical protein